MKFNNPLSSQMASRWDHTSFCPNTECVTIQYHGIISGAYLASIKSEDRVISKAFQIGDLCVQHLNIPEWLGKQKRWKAGKVYLTCK